VADLVGRPTASGEGVRGGCLFAWNLTVSRSTVVMEVERRTDQTLPFRCTSGLLQAHCVKIQLSENH
jgi:hypothetical protein